MKPIEWTTEAPPGGGEMTLEQREYINALRRRIEAQNALAESLVADIRALTAGIAALIEQKDTASHESSDR
jgi:hypothetical protein